MFWPGGLDGIEEQEAGRRGGDVGGGWGTYDRSLEVCVSLLVVLPCKCLEPPCGGEEVTGL